MCSHSSHVVFFLAMHDCLSRPLHHSFSFPALSCQLRSFWANSATSLLLSSVCHGKTFLICLESFAPAAAWKKAQMAMGRAMRPEQPDLRQRNHRDLEFPSETVPEEIRELWASLPRCGRQRRRRRYFRDQGACCSRAVFSSLLSTIDIRVQNIESALPEYLHATAASIPVPPARSCKKSSRKDAGPPSSPAPVNIVNGTLPGNSPAAEPARTAVSPSPTVPDSTAAAAVCASAPSSAPPISDGGTRRDSTALPSGLEMLSEHGSLSSPARKRALLQPVVAASAFAAARTDLASRSADVPMAEPATRPAQPSLVSWLRRAAAVSQPFTGICGTDPWWATPTPVPSGMVTGPSTSDPVTSPPTVSDILPDSEAKHRH